MKIVLTDNYNNHIAWWLKLSHNLKEVNTVHYLNNLSDPLMLYSRKLDEYFTTKYHHTDSFFTNVKWNVYELTDFFQTHQYVLNP